MNNVRPSWVMMPTWLQFFLGFALVGAIGWAAIQLIPDPDLPEGWQIIRPPQDVMALVLYQEEIWSGGQDGLYRIDPVKGSVIERINNPVKFRGVTSLIVDSSRGWLWVGHSKGLSRLDSDGWRSWEQADGLPDNQVLALCLTSSDELWVGTPHGVALQDMDNFSPDSNAIQWEIISVDDGLASEAISTIFQDQDGGIWLGDGFTQQGGLTLLSNGIYHIITAPDQVAHPVVNDIIQDQSGNLWFGVGFSNRGGATRYNGNEWISFNISDGLAGPKTRTLFEDTQGVLWFGSEYDGIARFDGVDWQVITPEQGLAGWEVKAMLQDPSGGLWLGTENGLSYLSAVAWQALGQSHLNQFFQQQIFSMSITGKK